MKNKSLPLLGCFTCIIILWIGLALGESYYKILVAQKNNTIIKFIVLLIFSLSPIAIGFILKTKEVCQEGINALPLESFLTLIPMIFAGLYGFSDSVFDSESQARISYISGCCFLAVMFSPSEKNK
ncbi:MAG: hypothetical protein GYA62_14390 [Bacteroidales bacterium]|nr:hypothetical protein [Bacteroidales bacterium]